MRPLSASKRSASIATLLALGRAATRTIRVKRSSGKPAVITARPFEPTNIDQKQLPKQFYEHNWQVAPDGRHLFAIYL